MRTSIGLYPRVRRSLGVPSFIFSRLIGLPSLLPPLFPSHPTPPYSVLFLFLLCRYVNDQNVRMSRVNLYGKPTRQYPAVFRNPRRFAGRPQSGAAVDIVAVVAAALVTRCRCN